MILTLEWWGIVVRGEIRERAKSPFKKSRGPAGQKKKSGTQEERKMCVYNLSS